MERRLKERLIGAAVLALAAVIFIPMILDNTSRRDGAITETNIPKRPEEDFSSRVVPAQEAAPAQPAGAAKQQAETPPQKEKSKTAPPQETRSETAAPPPGQPETSAKPEAPSTPAQAARGETQPAAPEKSVTPSAPAAKSESAVPVQEKSASAPAQRGLPEYVVQIGAFGSKANADRLIKKLRDGGYHAFVETVTQDSQTVYRVRVGPELRRSRAEALKKKLTQDLKMKGMLVMRYP